MINRIVAIPSLQNINKKSILTCQTFQVGLLVVLLETVAKSCTGRKQPYSGSIELSGLCCFVIRWLTEIKLTWHSKPPAVLLTVPV